MSPLNLSSLRQYVDTTLTATGKLQRPGGIGVDPETGADVPILDDIFTGSVLVYANIAEPDNPEAGGATFTVTTYTVILPKETLVDVGDVLTVTAAPEAPESVGAVFRITAAPRQTWQVARICHAQMTE